MPDQDFQDRLQRIAQNKPAGPARTGKSPSANSGSPNLSKMVVAVIVIFIGAGLARFANENYEALKADGGVGLALGIGLGATATLISGMVLFWRSVRNRPAEMALTPRPQQASGAARPERTDRRPLNLALMVVAVLVIWIGAGLVRFANQNYDELKAGGGVGLSLGIGIGAIAIVIWGIVLFVRSIRPRAVSADQMSLPDETRGTKNRLAITGGVLGVASAICMFMAGTALRVETASAKSFSDHMLLAAVLLLVVATMVALVTRITPGFGFFRVVLSYLTGFILVLGIVRVVQFDLRSWPAFMALLE